jgi:cytochrome c nitrite reductase small subunit
MRSMLVMTLAAAVLLGLAAGVGGYTFIYARGASYLSDAPSACANCHVMREQYDGWRRSSHRMVATCNDCHTPTGFLAKYAVKAANGFWHSFAFTSGRFPEPIRIKPGNLAIAQASCGKCHGEITSAIAGPHRSAGPRTCSRCHASAGHLH